MPASVTIVPENECPASRVAFSYLFDMPLPSHSKPPPDADDRRAAKPVIVYAVDKLPAYDAAFYDTARSVDQRMHAERRSLAANASRSIGSGQPGANSDVDHGWLLTPRGS
jgi:hypothetical protein